MDDPDIWQLYFPTLAFEIAREQYPLDNYVDVARRFFSSGVHSAAGAAPTLHPEERLREVEVQYELLHGVLKAEGLLDFLLSEPLIALAALNLAFHLEFLHKEGAERTTSRDGTQRTICTRIIDFEPITPVRQVKTTLIGKLVAVRGTVIRNTTCRPLVLHMRFQCVRCNADIDKHFTDGKYASPTRCPNPECKSSSFVPIRSSAVTVDWQSVKIQELMSDTSSDSGRVPRTLECEVTGPLVDSCSPGDVVTVVGTVKSASTGGAKGNRIDPNSAMHSLYLDANSIQNHKQGMGQKVEPLLSTKDFRLISMIFNDEDTFRLVVNSICPSIYGHQLVKAGLAMALFGGSSRHSDEQDSMPIRGDPHLFIVGDPGLGKSQMLTAMSQIAPRGVYVCGTYASSSGLTVTLSREKGSGEFAIEAGALVLGDQGICCIDEFDKMPQEHHSLLEAMEQQSISIAKAGIVCSLPARTSIIAAANPVGGHYNRSKTVCENLKVSPAILSRFDLIFILLDKPDEEMDQLLSDHIMGLHSSAGPKEKKLASTPSTRRKTLLDEQPMASTLEQRLTVDTKTFDYLPGPLLRKYIAYARQYVHPVMSPAAAKILQDFYITLREKHKSIDSTPITTRQLESLIRLSEARAKIELREVVEESDALDVVEIMKESLFQTLEDEYGNIDFRRTTGVSNQSGMRAFIRALERAVERRQHEGEPDYKQFSLQDMQQIKERMNLKVANFREFVDNLNTAGYIIKRGPRLYEYVGAD